VSHSLLRRALVAFAAGSLVLTACAAEDPSSPPAAAQEPEAGPDEETDPDPAADPFTERAPLTGVLVEDDVAADLAARPLLIVKIENSPQARPQAGLDRADVVLEELVEGGMTRFISLFHADLPDDVGPVRSARPVDVALGSGFGQPVFAYSGARPAVQSLLRSSPLIALEEGAPGFHRVLDRRSPHDLFVRPAEAVAAGVARGAGPIVAPGWAFSEDPPPGAVEAVCDDTAPQDDGGTAGSDCLRPGDEIHVDMSTSSRTGFVYDEAAGVYRRDQGGQPSVVTGDGRIGAANVVVLATRHYTDGCCDSNGAPYAETAVVGEDVAIVLRDGQRYDARWRKTADAAPLELLGSDGEPFPLRPGPTWILLPSSAVVAGL
jgi:hypothetical protein